MNPIDAARLNEIESRFYQLAANAVAAQSPYIWGGKGDQLWTPSGVISNPFAVEVFDCSGLVTTCLKRAGGPDLRWSHGAKQLREQCPADGEGIRLRFYPGHVAILVGPNEVIEAAGGDQTTIYPKPGGHVRRGRDLRASHLSEGSLSALVCQLLGLR